MININLLPKFQVASIQWLISILMSLALIIFLHAQCKDILLEKQHTIDLLKKEIQTMDKEILNPPKKNSAVALSNNSSSLPVLFLLRKLPRTMPPGIYLTEISKVRNSLRLVGYAEKVEFISGWVATLAALHFAVSVEEMGRKKDLDEVSFCVWIK